ncbi:unnamed protein product, partial [Closterium sp. NIES-54]
MLPYLFPDLAAFATVADLITHLRTSDARYHSALPTEFCAKSPPPMYITLYYLVTRLPDSLASVRDHFLSLCPIELTVDLLEERLTAAEKSILAVGASCGDPRAPFFEGCSPVPLLPSIASAVAVDLVRTEEVGAAYAPSGRRRNSKGKGGKGSGGDGGGGGGGDVGGGGGGVGGGGGGRSGGFGGGGGGGGGSGSSGGGGGGGGAGRGGAAQRGGFGETCRLPHTGQHCFGRLTDAWRAQFPDAVELPRWGDLHMQNVAIFDLDFDAILAAMYAAGATGPIGARTGGTGAGGAGGTAGVRAVGAGAVATGGAAGAGTAGGTGAGGAAEVVAGDPGAEGTCAVTAVSGGASRTRPYYVPLLQQILGLLPSTGPPPPLLSPPPVQSQSQLQPASSVTGPSSYSGQTRVSESQPLDHWDKRA